MASHELVTDRILGAVQRSHGCDLDTLTNSLSDLSWGQVFLEVDRLSREGEILVTLDTGGRYMIRLPERKESSTTQRVRSWSTKEPQGTAK
jgi:predicted  nucleic acid-binding Zn-ribbon protein